MKLILGFLLASFSLMAQQGHTHSRVIHFPDTEDYRTLTVDLHMHTVFSDGSVWPDIRVQEAVKDSIDAISLTEHLEYQPHAADLPHPDRNRSYEIAEVLGRPHDLLVIRGAEITRAMPPGHCNAVFIEDANKLLTENAMDAFAEAHRQGAFTFWNHPNWIAQRPDGVATLTPLHRELIDMGYLQGIEVVNDLTISQEALQLAIDNNLTILGTSDIHGLVDWQFHVHEGGHRPVTLVLATERSAEAIEEALRAGRTVAYFENTLVGLEEHLRPVVAASLQVVDAAYRGPSAVADVTIRNTSDCAFTLENATGYALQSDLGLISIPPDGETTISVMTGTQLAELTLRFRVLNAVTAPNQTLMLELATALK